MTRGTEPQGAPGEGGEGNRRRRDRHRRGDRGDRPDRNGQAEPAGDRGDAAPAPSLAPMVDVTHLPRGDAPPPLPSTPRAIEPERRPPPAAVEVVAPALPRAVPEPSVPSPAAVAPPPRPAQPLPPVAMKLPPDSGLEMIETRSKGAPVPEPEVAPAAGPRRVRPPRVVIAEEPLQIIETRKDSSPPPG